MDLRHLRHFVVIVETGSFSRAAAQIGMTQSALSRSIQALEQSVGTVLLERGAGGAAPTKAGTAMYEYARFLLHETDRIVTDVRRAAEGRAGSISVSVNPVFAEIGVPQALAAFARKYDRVDIRIHVGDVEETIPLLLGGEVDLVISSVPNAPMRSNLDYKRLGSVRWTLFAAPDHPLAIHPDRAAAGIAGQRWVMLDHRHEMDALARHLAERNAGMPEDAVRTASLPLMRSLILDCGMIGLMPARYMAGTGAIALPAFGPPIVKPVGLISRPDSRMPHALREFIDLFGREFRERFPD